MYRKCIIPVPPDWSRKLAEDCDGRKNTPVVFGARARGVAHGARSPSNHSVTIPCKVGRGTFLTRPTLVLPETKTLLSLWRSLGQGAVPKRAQFSPLQVRALLPNIFIL